MIIDDLLLHPTNKMKKEGSTGKGNLMCQQKLKLKAARKMNNTSENSSTTPGRKQPTKQ